MRRLTLLLPLLLLGGVVVGTAAGCAAPRLADERAVEPFASLLSQADEQGTAVHLVDGAAPGSAPLPMQLTQMPRTHRGTGPLLVLQSGVMADASSWRFLAPLLAEEYDLLLVDPPGCGGSAKPEARRLGEDAYTPTWLGQHTLRAVDRWEQAQGTDRSRPIVFVGHSLGSTSLMMALGDRETRAALPAVTQRVEKLVLFQPADVGMVHVHEDFEKLTKLPDALVHVGNAVGATGYLVKKAIHESVLEPRTRAHRQEAESFQLVVGSDDTRHAAQAMLRRFRKVDACGTVDWLHVQEREERYRLLQMPVLIVWGAQDDVLEAAIPPRLQKKLPDARVRQVPDAKHSPHQERPRLCAQWVRAFLEAE